MIELRCDVLVVGAGAAGIAAAIAAGRRGAEVIVLEQSGTMGGMATQAEVGTICGLFHRGGVDAPKFVNHGFPSEFSQNCPGDHIRTRDGLWFQACSAWEFERAAAAMLCQNKNVQPILQCTACGAEVNAGRVSSVQVVAAGERLRISPHAVVDCTGDAAVVKMVGGAVRDFAGVLGDAYIIQFDGCETGLPPEQLGLAARRIIVSAAETGKLPACTVNAVLVFTGKGRPVLHCKVPLPATSVPNWLRATDRATVARKIAADLLKLLQANALFRDLTVRSFAMQAGIRLTTVGVGRASLADADVSGCRKHVEGVCRGTWPIEEWDPDGRQRLELLPEGDYYDIPLSALESDGYENLLMAGRCFSAGPRAMASARVIGTCLATGYAAGMAAAMQGTSRAIMIESIREELVS